MPIHFNDLEQLGCFLGLGKAEQKDDRLRPNDSPPDDTGDSVFVCVDLEAFEFDQTKILETGFACLDSRDLIKLAPGDKASTWMQHIKSYHYIVEERKHLVNKRYVKGCPEGFVFGKSQYVPAGAARALFRQHFTQPRSISDGCQPTTPDEDSPSVFVAAHGLKNDLVLMKHFGIDNIYETGIAGEIDTQKLCSAKRQSASLKRLLDALDVPYEHLHNAANDATYTLQALVKMIWMKRFEPAELDRVINLLKNPPVDPNRVPKRRRGPKGEGERSIRPLVRQVVVEDRAAAIRRDSKEL
ncbi:hypothetical protein CAC42_2285 [Sphaceloma murrayae]|uniref:Gfd2/YDR514C-like C-terminal domain-containing protein n=1 Tax=Sphaceloma murrayae TaxID=2082308 RepID=A0A2K1QIT0_9PEZI|nr:hypothetical protein CAC42_2285 [Sphaceloma murrayae]